MAQKCRVSQVRYYMAELIVCLEYLLRSIFKSLTGFVRIKAFQRSNERSERGDHPV
eukprot:COSAG06_NODE_1163_length_10454_cov_16.507677_6_plen_56_part_00